MEKKDKLIENLMKIKRVGGFYVTIPGDMSVGLNDQEFIVSGDFYFDKEVELVDFKNDLAVLFTNYCSEICLVETFDERQSDVENEMLNQ